MNRMAMIVLKNICRLPYAAAKLFRYATHPARYTREQKYRLVQYLAERIEKTGNVEIRVFGRENIPKEGGFIFYPNHQGMFDGVAMLRACDVPFSPVIKRELMEVPFVKWIMACLESLPMDREDVRQSIKVMQEVAERVGRKENCLIFPEGTRSRNGNRLLEFKNGSFKAAVKAQCPIVPVALVDSFKPFDRKGTDKVDVRVHILSPIAYREYQGMGTSKIAELVWRQIKEVVERKSDF